MEKYRNLAEKFIDKGYIQELHWLVPVPMLFDPSMTQLQIYGSREKARERYDENAEKVYGEDWDYWNAWIDTKLPK